MTTQFMVAFLYAVICTGVMIYVEKSSWNIKRGNAVLMLLAVLAAGGALRRYFAWQPLYFWYDLRFFREWGDALAYYGMKNVYSSGIFLDYPPGYMYVLWLSNMVQDYFGMELYGQRYTFILKCPAMAADLAGAVLIYYVAAKKLNEKTALFLATAYTFCPAIVYNSSAWGQIDSWYTLFLVVALYFVTEDRVVPASVAYALALITKPQALLFGPVLLFWVISKKDIKVLLSAVATGLGCIWLLALPFSQSLSPLWLIKLYANTFGGYKYFTVNGYNLYMLAGRNYNKVEAGTIFPLINPVVICLCFAFCCFTYFKKHRPERNFSTAIVFITVFFSFCTMMHERYLHPAIILAVFAYIYSKQKGWLAVGLAAAVSNYLNVASVLRSMYADVVLVDSHCKIISIIAIVTSLLAVIVTLKDTFKTKVE